MTMAHWNLQAKFSRRLKTQPQRLGTGIGAYTCILVLAPKFAPGYVVPTPMTGQ